MTSVNGGNGAENVSNTYSYDKGKLKTIGHNGFNYGFNYDGFGNVTSTAVGNKNLVSNTYNNRLGALTKSTFGNGQAISYEYDSHGNVSKVINSDGTTFTYTYDSKQNPLTVASSEPIGTGAGTGATTKYYYDFIDRPYRIVEDGHEMNVSYDDKNRVASFKYRVRNTETATNYIYGNEAKGEAPSRIYGLMVNNNRILDYTYDKLSRTSKRTLNTTSPFVTEFTYATGGGQGQTTTLAESIKNKDNILSYTYDALGNILTITNDGVLQNSYTYDSLNQLTSDVDHFTGIHNEYVYDNGGNISSKTSYTLNENGEKTNSNTIDYGYGDGNWKDKLTSYNGEAITYDEIGNPINYRDGLSFSWRNGRQLNGFTSPIEGESTSYFYNDQGIRIGKKNQGKATYFTLNGTKILAQTSMQYDLNFLYDNTDEVIGFVYKDNSYYYVKNIQNDIIGILDKDGNQVVSYTYDAWGKLLTTTGTMAETIGKINPFRYRSYYYDNETGLYYLNSRYYDPDVGRFLNADDISVLGESPMDVTDKNVFAYCDNNPVIRVDSSGDIWDIIDIGFAAWSWTDFIMKPSWGNLGWALLDSVALLPLIPSPGYLTRSAKIVSKSSKTVKTTKAISKSSKVVPKTIKISQPIKKVAGKISGYTKHGLAQALGRDGGRGVKVSSILDTVRNPTKVVLQEGGTTKYVGKQAVVVLNSKGQVVTTYAKSSKYWR